MRGMSAVLAVMLLACGAPPDDQRTDTVDPTTAGRADMSDQALAQLDSGNVAYRAASYEQALRHYARVAELAPDQATGWFGMYMAHHALGNMAAADSALAKAEEVAPGASLIRDTLDEGGAP